MATEFSVSYPDTNSIERTYPGNDGEVYTVRFERSSSSRSNYNYYNERQTSINCYKTLNVAWKTSNKKNIEISSQVYPTEKFSQLCLSNRVSFSLNELIAYDVFKVRITPYVPVSQVDFNASVKPPSKKKPVQEKKLELLSTDMLTLFKTGNHSDVVLTDGTKEIPVHKNILSIRSPVFSKMFEHPMRENIENKITIKDIAIEILEKMLHFMYTGTVIVEDSTMARELYVASHKYGIEGLTDICSAMLKTVDLSNVLDTLLLADLHSDKVLKKAALDFIAKYYSQLKALKKWTSFMKENQPLALEVLSFVIDTK